MKKLFFDLRFVLRQLARSPSFAITAVLMLAFGIGSTTAIFSVVEAVMLRPLPFPDSGRLMVLSDRLAGVNVGGNGGVGVTVPDIRAYTRETHGFSALGGYQGLGTRFFSIEKLRSTLRARCGHGGRIRFLPAWTAVD